MATNEELGKTIRDARLDKGMSLGQLASAVGRSSSSVRRWERGEVLPGAGSKSKLVAILEIDAALFEPRPAAVVEQSSEASQNGTANDDEDADVRVSTFEQPAVVAPPLVASPTDDNQNGTQASSRGLLGDAWASLGLANKSWIGWVRGLLTAVAIVLMIFVLVWAIGELLTALNDILDTFDVGTTPDSNA